MLKQKKHWLFNHELPLTIDFDHEMVIDGFSMGLSMVKVDHQWDYHWYVW